MCYEGVHPQAFGYNQGWSDGQGFGVWRGPDVIESSRHNVTDPTKALFGMRLPVNRGLGATKFAAALDGPGTYKGMVMVEHVVYGTYKRYGFEGPTRSPTRTQRAHFAAQRGSGNR